MPPLSMVCPESAAISLCDGGSEPVAGLAGGDEDQTGGGAQLSGAAGHGGDVLLGQSLCVAASGRPGTRRPG